MTDSLDLQTISSDAAGLLLDGGCVLFDTDKRFRYASGIVSPVYTDCRRLLSEPRLRNRLAQMLHASIREILGRGIADLLIAGVATAGIPHATIIADRTQLPLIYVRSEAKGHGTQRMLEGTWKPGAKAILVEDVISTGRSVLAAAKRLREAEIEVVTCLSILHYGFAKTRAAFESLALPVISLTDLPALLEAGKQLGALDEERKAAIVEWWVGENSSAQPA